MLDGRSTQVRLCEIARQCVTGWDTFIPMQRVIFRALLTVTVQYRLILTPNLWFYNYKGLVQKFGAK